MTKIIADITMSLDGYVTAPGADLEHGLGVGGEPLHDWAIESDDPVDAEILATSTEQTGAVIMGRRLFDIIDGPQGWNEEMGYGAHHAAVRRSSSSPTPRPSPYALVPASASSPTGLPPRWSKRGPRRERRTW